MKAGRMITDKNLHGICIFFVKISHLTLYFHIVPEGARRMNNKYTL